MYILFVYNNIFSLGASFDGNLPEVAFQIAIIHVLWLLADMAELYGHGHHVVKLLPKLFLYYSAYK
jgi:hypothetical protein